MKQKLLVSAITVILAASVSTVCTLPFLIGLEADRANARLKAYEANRSTWHTIMPASPPDVPRTVFEHLQQPGNWVSTETQINDDCGLRFIIELGTGPLPEPVQPPVGPQPTPAPPRLNPGEAF